MSDAATIRRPHELATAAREGFHPNAVYAFGDGSPDDLPLLEGKSLVDGSPAVYICERFACRAPITDRPRWPRRCVSVDLEPLKRDAAEAAIEAEIRSGMVLGLGTGSTARWLLEGLGRRVESGELADITGVPTSERRPHAAASWGSR